MYNATNAAPWLFAPQRFATRLSVLRRVSIQRNDLFISFRASTRSDLARRVAAPRIAPQLNDLFVTPRLVASPRIAAPRLFTQRSDLFVTPRRNVAYSIAALFYSTQRFVCDVAPFRSASPRRATQRTSSQLNDLFVTPLLPAAIRISTLRNATL